MKIILHFSTVVLSLGMACFLAGCGEDDGDIQPFDCEASDLSISFTGYVSTPMGYSFTVVANGGTGPYDIMLSNGSGLMSVPQSLEFTVIDPFETFTATITDSLGCSVSDTIAVYQFGTGTFRDSRDGHVYRTVFIDDKEWFAENLNYAGSGACYDLMSANCEIYGRMYSWNSAMTACPSSYRLPTDDDWKRLEAFLGMSVSEANAEGPRGTDEGGKMKAISDYWAFPNTGATNESGFSGLPGGYCNAGGCFQLGQSGSWWSATETGADEAWVRILKYDDTYVYRQTFVTLYFSACVRCLR